MIMIIIIIILSGCESMNCSQKWLPMILLTLILGINGIIGCTSTDTTETVNSETKKSDNQEQTNHRDQLDITVSIIPQEYFVKKIGGDRVRVNVMVEPGVVPHTYEPKVIILSNQSAKTIAKEIKGEVLLISPLAADWSNNLLEVSRTFAKVLKEENSQ